MPEMTHRQIKFWSVVSDNESNRVNGLKTIAMNIRSINEETGSYDETLESIKDTIYGITGVSAFTDSTKQTYKSTYDYLKDISEVWDELSDKQQSTIASELFGKFQASSVCLVM